MKKPGILLAITAVLALEFAHSQPPGNTQVRLLSTAIEGALVAASDTVLYVPGTGSIVKFPFQFINRDTTRYGVSNSLVVWSPDGLQWSHTAANWGNYKFTTPITGLWVDTTGIYPRSDFDGDFRFDCLSCDGLGRDTLVFTAIASDPGSPALRALDSGVIFKIVVNLKREDTCKQICFDSVSNAAPFGGWKWMSVNHQPSYETVPTWSGPRCFQIRQIRNMKDYPANACCVGTTGNVDCDPENLTDISDLVRLIDYAYITFDPLCCYPAANISGDEPGQVDIGDISYLINYLYIDFHDWWLAPCGGWACNR